MTSIPHIKKSLKIIRVTFIKKYTFFKTNIARTPSSHLHVNIDKKREFFFQYDRCELLDFKDHKTCISKRANESNLIEKLYFPIYKEKTTVYHKYR